MSIRRPAIPTTIADGQRGPGASSDRKRAGGIKAMEPSGELAKWPASVESDWNQNLGTESTT